MKGSRPEQAQWTRDNDLTKTGETRRVVEAMVDGLNDHVIDGVGTCFHQDFRWVGNAGCCTELGLKAIQVLSRSRTADDSDIHTSGLYAHHCPSQGRRDPCPSMVSFYRARASNLTCRTIDPF